MDRIGNLYNFIRKELDDFFSDVRPVEDFRGAICGGSYDREMRDEVYAVNKMYAVNIGLLMEKRAAYVAALASAQTELDEVPIAEARASKEGAARRKALFRKRNQAQVALNAYEERMRKEMRNLANIIRKWAERRTGGNLTG